MSKQVLQSMFHTLSDNRYSWTLYFFKKDRRVNQQPYSMYKVHFKSDNYLSDYAKSLLNATNKFQVDPLSCVQEYDGENTKVTCDKISLSNNLICEQWKKFFDATTSASSSDKEIKGNLQGYILDGQPYAENLKSVSFVKIANPVTKMNTKKSIVFTNSNDELDLMTEDVYRLYLTVDFIVYDNFMYTFNHSFEKLFNIEKTMSKVKATAINKIIETNGIGNADDFKNYANSYSSSRTFITLKNKRLERLSDSSERRNISERLNIPLDASGNLHIEDSKQASILIKYLCYKIFLDGETNDLLEASSVSELFPPQDDIHN